MLSFFLAGVQKAGTTALHRYLSEHPRIELPDVKELHFFDNENVDWNDPDFRLLRSHFSFYNDPNILCGDCTPVYTYWPESLERIRRYNPRAKLIVSLRHPAYRAYSQWAMQTARGRDDAPFEYAVSWLGRDRVRSAPRGVHRKFSYVERGFYGRQMERVLANFPRDQVIFLRADKLWHSPNQTLSKVCDFLDIESMGAVQTRFVAPVERDRSLRIPRAVLGRLSRLYADDIIRTGHVTGLNLDDWLDPYYVEPMDSQPAELSSSSRLPMPAE